jgi:pyridoxamine 5'-phosphate oxidase
MPDRSRPLSEEDLAPDPFVQFGRWFDEAVLVVRHPEAMALGTASVDGRPSVRMVLMKSWDESGFVFYTNYASRKGLEIAENAHVAALFHWDALDRQVRIEGDARRISSSESDAHFAARPRGAQIGAHASWQSRPIGTRSELDERVRQLVERFSGRSVPRPSWWGGFRLHADVVEFWQSREDRLHDRLQYQRLDVVTATETTAGTGSSGGPGGAATSGTGGHDRHQGSGRWRIVRLQP